MKKDRPDKNMDPVKNAMGAASHEWKNGDLEKAMDHLKQAWEELPGMKTDDPRSYTIARDMIALSLESLSDDQALEWAEKLQECVEREDNPGDQQFWLGKTHYTRGESEAAKDAFLRAYKESEGKRFKGEPDKFYELIREDLGGGERGNKLQRKVEEADEALFSGELQKGLKLFTDLLEQDRGADNPYIIFRKGQCHFELGEYEAAATHFATAYLLDGEAIFEGEAPKYLEFLKEHMDES